ncbi:auxin-responsive protein SAUR36-like [Lolium rigidum]|uniref:auxin-responsive protein SAUR36-like n=1 Tax=Lolium rigidum TaxID=89674 RepID=UPI001F5CE052|nr:auxin-responsive protein SAUR36-like [Lolium rigidum]
MMASRHRGFRIGRKLLGLCRWALSHRRRRRGGGYLRLQRCQQLGGTAYNSPAAFGSAKKQQQLVVLPRDEHEPRRRVLTWGRSLARRMRLFPRRGSAGGGGERLLEEEAAEATTPKGQVAVYVGGDGPGGESSMRYVVPVVYFNHPLFGELLREAEEEFGFKHPGGITIPCAATRFERAAAVAGSCSGRKVPAWW